MGYGIDHNVLGRTGDGGIDGVIKDKLGLDEIYFQAKRWKNTVKRSRYPRRYTFFTRIS